MSDSQGKTIMTVLDRKGIQKGRFPAVMDWAIDFAAENPGSHSLVIVPHWVWVADCIAGFVERELALLQVEHVWRYNWQTVVLKNQARINFKPGTVPGVRENLSDTYARSFEIVDDREEITP